MPLSPTRIPALSETEIADLIRQAHAQDVGRAQALLAAAVAEAGALWTPMDAIADALALTLVETATRVVAPGRVAAVLEATAQAIRNVHTNRLDS